MKFFNMRRDEARSPYRGTIWIGTKPSGKHGHIVVTFWSGTKKCEAAERAAAEAVRDVLNERFETDPDFAAKFQPEREGD